MKKAFTRYVVLNGDRLHQHCYSAKIENALDYAISCADHWTMRADVYGEDESGERTLLKKYKKSPKDNAKID